MTTQLLPSGVSIPFEVSTDTGLFVALDIFETTTGSPVSLTQVVMTEAANGTYVGFFTPGAGKSYLVQKSFYTDGTYTVLDSSRFPASEVFVTNATGAQTLTTADIAVIAAAVWDLTRAGHVTSGTFGEAVAAIKTKTDQLVFLPSGVEAAFSPATLAEMIDGVWDEALVDHVNAGTMGHASNVADTYSPAIVASAVWSELRAGHTSGGTFGQSLQGVLSTTRAANLDLIDAATSTRAAASALATAQTAISDIQTKVGSPAGVSMSADIAAVKSDTAAVKTQTDQIAFDSGRVVAKAEVISDKSGYALSTANQDIIVGKVWDATRAGHTTSGTFGESNQGVVSSARATKLDNLDAAITSRQSESAALSRYTDLNSDIATVDSKVSGIQNNTTFVGVVPTDIVLPSAGTKDYKFFVNLFDTLGNPEDPDANTMNIKIEKVDGTTVIATLPMARTAVGQYVYTYTVNASDTQQVLNVIFTYAENSIAFRQVRTSEVKEFQSKLDILLARVTSTRAANLDNLDALVSTRATQLSVDSVQADTDNLQAIIGLPSGASLAGDVTTLKTNVTAIKTKTDQLTFSGGRAVAKAEVVSDKTGYALSTASEDAVVDKVWDEPNGAHVALGTTGRKLSDLAATSPLTVAAAVWDEARSGHTTSGTFGQSLQGVLSATRAVNLDNLDTTISSRESESSASTRAAANATAHLTTQGKVDAVRNSHVFSHDLPSPVEIPASGTKAYKFLINFTDLKNGITDPDSNQVYVAIDTVAGSSILAATLISRPQAALYEYEFDVTSTFTPAVLVITFTYLFGGQAFKRQYTIEAVSTAALVAALDSRLTSGRAVNLDNLNATISSRQAASVAASQYAAAITAITAIDTKLGTPVGASVSDDIGAVKADAGTLVSRLSPARAAKLDNLDIVLSTLESESSAATRASAVTTSLAGLATEVAKIGIPDTGTLAGDIAQLSDELVGMGSIQDQITAVAGQVTALSAKVGTPAGASVSADIATVKTDVLAIPLTPLLTTDSRLNRLDVAVSTRATPADILAGAAGLNLIELVGMIEDGAA